MNECFNYIDNIILKDNHDHLFSNKDKHLKIKGVELSFLLCVMKSTFCFLTAAGSFSMIFQISICFSSQTLFPWEKMYYLGIFPLCLWQLFLLSLLGKLDVPLGAHVLITLCQKRFLLFPYFFPCLWGKTGFNLFSFIWLKRPWNKC